jgi:hypothetical protein
MEHYALFLVEIGVSLAGSLLVLLFWSKSLKRILVDICGTEDRAAFWLIYSNIMLFITPLLSVILFGHSGDTVVFGFAFLKRAVGAALLGIFVALAVIGLQVAKFLPRSSDGGRKI